jgi:hypothetical protein
MLFQLINFYFYFRHTEEVVVGYGDSETESDEDGSDEDDDYDLDSVISNFESNFSLFNISADDVIARKKIMNH